MKNYFERTNLKTGKVTVVSMTDNHNKGAEFQCEKLNSMFEGIATYKVATEEQKQAKIRASQEWDMEL